MQWIGILAGLLLGWQIDNSLMGAVMGGILGLAISSVFRLDVLSKEISQSQQDLALLKETQHLFELRLQQLEPDVVAQTQDKAVESEAFQATESLPEPDVIAPLPAEEFIWNSESQYILSDELAAEFISDTPAEFTSDTNAVEPQYVAEHEVLHHEPGFIENTIIAARNWLLGGNTVLRLGVVVLFLGLAFLLRYATEGVVISVEIRYVGVAFSALCLLALGWWLRLRNNNYALMLQGTGIAVLYLTVFAALRLNPLLEPGFAFGLLVAVTVFSAILSITQNSRALSAVAALGGFAAPVLTSSGTGSHVALFSYFALLNAGILAIAWFKAWRILNVIGFVGTFGIGFAWGIRSYTPDLLWSTEPFLVLFFLIYLSIGLLFSRRKLRDMPDAPENDSRTALLRWSVGKGDYVDGVMLFGPPLVGFALQFALVQHQEFAVAFSALALGGLYMGLARMLVHGRALLLSETCLALGIIFVSLAIPLALDAGWTSAVWAVEGAGIFWLGLRQQRPLGRCFALLLQVGAALAYRVQLYTASESLLAGSSPGALLLGIALLFTHFQLSKAATEQVKSWEHHVLPLLAVCGLSFLFLLFPLNLSVSGVSIGWAIAGLCTLFAGLRLQSTVFLVFAFSVQLLAGVLCLSPFLNTGADSYSGWFRMFSSLLAGISLIGGMVLVARDEQLHGNKRLCRGLGLILLAGLMIINLAMLYVLSWHAVGGVWALSGLLTICISLCLQQRLSFIFGLSLQLIGGGVFLLGDLNTFASIAPRDGQLLSSTDLWVPLALSLTALTGAWYLQREKISATFSPLRLHLLSNILLSWGAVWWAFATWANVLRFVPQELQAAVLLGVAALCTLLWTLLGLRLKWPSLSMLSVLLCPVSVLILLVFCHEHYHPAENFGWLAWPFVLAAHFFSLHRLTSTLPSRILSITHVIGCWLLVGLLMLELHHGLLMLSGQYNAWRWLGWIIIPGIYLVLMASPRSWPWPVSIELRAYRFYAALPMAVLMPVWFWLANLLNDGSAEPLPYLPLINPLEISLLFSLFGVYVWVRNTAHELPFSAQQIKAGIELVAGVSLFAFFTMFIMRMVHHWVGIPFQMNFLLKSMLVQAGLSITWTLLALSLMVGGHLRHRREVWLIGAALIAVVIAKLFFIELGNRGGLARIVSFIAVGVLLLVVGYFAPLPPKHAGSVSENPENETEESVH